MRCAALRPRCIIVSEALPAQHGAMGDMAKAAAGSACGGRWRWPAGTTGDRDIGARCVVWRGEGRDSGMVARVAGHARGALAVRDSSGA